MSKRTKNYKLQIINIKYRTESKDGPNYAELFHSIYKDKISSKILGNNRYAILRTCYPEVIDSEQTIYSGKFTKFTKLESNEWLDMNTLESTSVDVPTNKYPNLLETDYFFFPSIHRLAVVINRNVNNINTVASFLIEALNKIKKENDIVEVIVEQSHDAFSKILNAEILQRLEINVSYSNSDNYEDAAEFVDGELRDSQTNSISAIAKPDHNGNILIEKSDILKGLLKLAQNNGNAKATIKNKDKREIINTSKYPKSVNVKATDYDNLKYNIFDMLTNSYSKPKNGS